MKKTITTILVSLLMAMSTSAQFLIEKKNKQYDNVTGNLQFTSDALLGWKVNELGIADIASITRKLDVRMNTVADASYFAGMTASSVDGSGDYYFCLSDVATHRGDDGTIYLDEPGVLMMFDLYAALSENPDAAVLPEGVFEVNRNRTAGTVDADYSYCKVLNADETISNKILESGSVTVKHTSDGGYSIVGEFVSEEGEAFTIRYEGKIEFANKVEAQDKSLMQEDVVDAVFKGMTITAHGGNDEYYRYTVQLFDSDEEGAVITKGVVLHVDLFSTPLEGDAITIADGTYESTVDYEELDKMYPFSFLAGDCFSILGYPLYIGTYLQDLRDADKLGKILYGYANAGAIEIKRDGDNYSVSVDLQTRNGKSITGTFNGKPVVVDDRPEEPAGPWSSTLTEDKNFVFSDDTFAYAHRYENSPATGVSEFELFVNDHITNETFQLNLVVPLNQKSPEGIYTVAKDTESGKYEAYTFIPGYQNLSVLGGTWAWQLYDKENAIIGSAPATDGTIEIKKNDDDTFTISFSLKDDAEPKHTITATWSGVINDPRGTWTK